jgi:hypothetical protein
LKNLCRLFDDFFQTMLSRSFDLVILKYLSHQMDWDIVDMCDLDLSLNKRRRGWFLKYLGGSSD